MRFQVHGFIPYKAWSIEANDYIETNMLKLKIENSGDDILFKVFQEMYSELKTMNSNNEQWVRKAFF